MIPKVIHYVWLGKNDKPNFVNACIVSWKEKMPDYKIIEWNEDNIDIEKIRKENKFFNECYKRKMYAYMADYIRLKVLYENGGIYFDTDIQVLKRFDDLLENKMVIGKEDKELISAGVIGVEQNNEMIKKALDFYNSEIWNCPIFTIPSILTLFIKEEDNVKIFPEEYFYPFSYKEKFSINCITENTYTIHWWGASWTEKTYNAFLNTKHIKNPIKRKVLYFKKVLGCKYRGIKGKYRKGK